VARGAPEEPNQLLEPPEADAAESDTNSGWGSWDARSEDEAAPTVVQPGAALTSRERESPLPVEPEWQVSSRKGKAAPRRDNATPNAVEATGAAQNGASQNGAAHNGVATNGVATNGVATNGVATNGVATNGHFESLPAGDLLKWLQDHAPEKYLQDRLQQLCKEVKKLE
jgi:hypothetical protein